MTIVYKHLHKLWTLNYTWKKKQQHKIEYGTRCISLLCLGSYYFAKSTQVPVQSFVKCTSPTDTCFMEKANRVHFVNENIRNERWIYVQIGTKCIKCHDSDGHILRRPTLWAIINGHYNRQHSRLYVFLHLTSLHYIVCI